MEPILEVRNLKKYFAAHRGPIYSRAVAYAKAVDDVSFTIAPGETFALVGESGCGKTTTTRLILLLEQADAGAILFRGRNVLGARGEELSGYRGSVQAVFQDPYSSLDPRMRIGRIVSEPLRGTSKDSQSEIAAKVDEVLKLVGLTGNVVHRFPHEFSGGQRQRIAVARALAIRPALVILDEPVSALDVSIRAQIMNLLKDLQSQLGLAYLLIAHDLATVRYMSHRVGIMYLGQIVEYAAGEDIFEHPHHPYTKALLAAALPFRDSAGEPQIRLPGEVPSPFDPPAGCRFHPRCPRAWALCAEREPQLSAVGEEHSVACHLFSMVGARVSQRHS